MIDAVRIDPVLFIRWRLRCDAEDVPEIKRQVEAASREIGADRLVYISLIPVGVPPPDTATRAALRDGTAHAKSLCASVHIVIEGSGLRRALIRRVSAGLLLATRASFNIHARLPEALALAARQVPMDVDAILAQATQRGLATTTDASANPS